MKAAEKVCLKNQRIQCCFLVKHANLKLIFLNTFCTWFYKMLALNLSVLIQINTKPMKIFSLQIYMLNWNTIHKFFKSGIPKNSFVTTVLIIFFNVCSLYWFISLNVKVWEVNDKKLLTNEQKNLKNEFRICENQFCNNFFSNKCKLWYNTSILIFNITIYN